MIGFMVTKEVPTDEGFRKSLSALLGEWHTVCQLEGRDPLVRDKVFMFEDGDFRLTWTANT